MGVVGDGLGAFFLSIERIIACLYRSKAAIPMVIIFTNSLKYSFSSNPCLLAKSRS